MCRRQRMSTSPNSKRLAETMLADRHRLAQQLRGLKQAQRAGKPFDRNLTRWQQDVAQSRLRFRTRFRPRPKIDYDGSLPIHACRDEIAAAIRENQVVVVSGETGLGQVDAVAEDLPGDRARHRRHDRPHAAAADRRPVDRRAAWPTSWAPRADARWASRSALPTPPARHLRQADDRRHPAGRDAGRPLPEPVRHDHPGRGPRALAEHRLPDRVPEAAAAAAARAEAGHHVGDDRLGAVRRHFARRGERGAGDRGLRPQLPGGVRYRPLEPDEEGSEPELEDAVVARGQGAGARAPATCSSSCPRSATSTTWPRCCAGRRSRRLPRPRDRVLPLYARLPAAQQQRVFQPHARPADRHRHERGRVVADGAGHPLRDRPRHRADQPLLRASRTQRLPIEPISRASADQRAGRCGRLGPGICVRLFGQQDYESRDRYATPEILRSNLASVILQTKALRLGDIAASSRFSTRPSRPPCATATARCSRSAPSTRATS